MFYHYVVLQSCKLAQLRWFLYSTSNITVATEVEPQRYDNEAAGRAYITLELSVM
jgi:hypothetical protein